ncbi:hypothetical protein [Roseovarius sp. MMSF_3281]|uniref:hypothetical protein n=1 Tax=Roseovarius sp. MMSF_3281 TaxID=3046694 RepID=UPI00273E135E|nr:hypothetical protein [Roseovarius sp. MMSF_3281]
MISLRISAYIALAIGAFLLFFAAVEESFVPLPFGVTGLLFGVLFLAADKALMLLTEIRDSLLAVKQDEVLEAPVPSSDTVDMSDLSERLSSAKTRAEKRV